MEIFQTQFRKRFRIHVLYKFFIFTVGIILSLQSLASVSSSSHENHHPTVRPWPSHDFFISLISNSTNASKTKNAEVDFVTVTQTINPISTTEVNLSNITLRNEAPDNQSIGSSSNVSQFHISNNNSSRLFYNFTNEPSIFQDINSNISKHDSRNLKSHTNETDLVNISISSKKVKVDHVVPVSDVATGIPLRIIDNRKFSFPINGGTNPIRVKYGGRGGSVNDETRWERLEKKQPARTSTDSMGEMKSIFPTAPAIPLFTGNPISKMETAVRSPLLIPFPTPKPIYKTKIPEGNWGLGNITVIATTQNKTKNIPLDRRYGILFGTSPETLFTAPPITMPMTSESIPELAETVKDPDNEMEELLLNIWNYSDEGLKLHSENLMPSNAFQGQNISEGSVLNLNDFPQPLRKLFESAFNLTTAINKRHSGPGSVDAFHWQQLPMSVARPRTTTLAPFWTKVTKRDNPVALHYVVWATPAATTSVPTSYSRPFAEVPPTPQLSYYPFTTPPPIPVTTPLPTKDYGYETWLQLKTYIDQQLTTLKNSSVIKKETGDNQLKDKDVLASVAAMALILSKINKDASKLPDSESTAHPILGATQTLLNKGKFWSSLLPIYLHYLKYGSAAPYKPLKQKLPTTGTFPTLWERGPEEIDISGLGLPTAQSPTDYSFYPQQSPAPTKVVTVQNDALPTRTNVVKYVTKKLKKLTKKKKKKSKKSKKGKGWGENYQNYAPYDVGPSGLNLGTSFDIDILGLLKNIFGAIIALKAAPLILLAAFSTVPLLLLLFSKFMLGSKIRNLIWKIIGHHHHHKSHGWHPGPHHGHGHHHPKKEVHHHFHAHPSPPVYHDVGDSHHGWQPHETYNHGHPGHHIDHLVHKTYGDISNHRLDHSISPSEANPTEAGMVLYDTDLNTAHNHRVMDILMESRNATLQKLLESWEVNFAPYNSTSEFDGTKLRKKKLKLIRRKRQTPHPQTHFNSLSQK